jgi:hypothetical protein
MIYRLVIDDAIVEQLRALPRKSAATLATASICSKRHSRATSRNWRGMNGAGGFESDDHRILFRLDGNVIHVYAVKQRKEAYE